MAHGLTPKQRDFIAEYLIDFDATHAARRANYALPNKSGPRVLHTPLVKAAIEAALAERRKANEITAERIRTELAKVAFGQAGPGLRTSDKVRALEMLGKHLGMFVDRTEITGKDGAPLTTITADATPEQAIEAYSKLLN